MQIRRCAMLMVEPREHLEFDLDVLFKGDTAFATRIAWVALAPHLDGEVELTDDDLPILARIGETLWIERVALPDTLDPARVDALVYAGLVIIDQPAQYRKGVV